MNINKQIEWEQRKDASRENREISLNKEMETNKKKWKKKKKETNIACRENRKKKSNKWERAREGRGEKEIHTDRKEKKINLTKKEVWKAISEKENTVHI